MRDDKFIVEFLKGALKDELYPKIRKRGFIKSKFTFSKKSKVLCVVVPYWHGKISKDVILRDKILFHNMSVLEYEFKPYVLSASADATVAYFTMIHDRISKDIEKFMKKHKFDECHIIGSSLGATIAVMVSNSQELVTKVILNSPSNSIAYALWEGIRTKNIKQEYEKQGFTKEKLENHWTTISPQNNITNMANKEVHIMLSKKDEVIPYKYGKKFVRLLKKNNVKVKVKEHEHLGHYLSIADEIIFSNDY